MTIVASIIIVVVIILGLIAGFAIFYRYKKRQWLNGRKGSDYRTPSSFLSTVSGNVSGNRRIHPNPISRYCFIMIDKKRCFFKHVWIFLKSNVFHFCFSSSSNSHPPPLPARPATASGALGKMGGSTHSISKVDGSSPTLPGSADFSNRASSNTSYHHQQQQFSRQRIQRLNASSTTSISREHQ